MNKNLDEVMHTVLKEYSFFGYVAHKMNKQASTDIKTSGHKITNGNITLYFNEQVLKTNSPIQNLLMIVHEISHIVLMHPLRRDGRENNLWMIACDMAVNTMFPEMKNYCKDYIFPGTFNILGSTVFLEEGKEAEWYYNKLSEQADKLSIEFSEKDGQQQVTVTNKETGKSQTFTIGDENASREADYNTSFEQDTIKNIIKDSFDKQMRSNGWGNTPETIRNYVDKIIADSIIPWKKQLKSFSIKSIRCGYIKSWIREDRRFGNKKKGKIIKRTARIGLGIDTSGSMCDPSTFEKILVELYNIMKFVPVEIEVAECDCSLKETYYLQKRQYPNVKFVGGGGTDFRPVFDYFNKRDIDGLIFFTDLYGTMPEGRYPFKTLWVSTTGSSVEVPFGTILDLSGSRKKQQ